MPKIPAFSHLPLYNGPMQIGITWPAVRETTGLTDALPTSEPASAQITYTIQATDLPTLNVLIPYRYIPFLYAYGRVTGGTDRSISYRVELNGTSIATGNLGTVTNNNYYCIYGWNWGANYVAVGDVLTLKLWASGAGAALSAHALIGHMNRPLYGKKRAVIWGAYGGSNSFVLETTAGAPSFGNPYTEAAVYFSYPTDSTAITNNYSILIPTAGVPNAIMAREDYGLYTMIYPDRYAGFYLAQDAASARPTVIKRPILLTYLPLNIKI